MKKLKQEYVDFIDEVVKKHKDKMGPMKLMLHEIQNKLGYIPFEAMEKMSEELRSMLFNLGYNLGKWIYLMDALDDLQKDMEQGKFNPINKVFNNEGAPFKSLYVTIHKRLEFSIMCSANGVLDCYEKLEKYKNDDLITNIITLGLTDRYEQVTNKYKEFLL